MSRTNKFLFSLTTAALVGSLAPFNSLYVLSYLWEYSISIFLLIGLSAVSFVAVTVYFLMLFLYRRFSGTRFLMPLFAVAMAAAMIVMYEIPEDEIYYISIIPACISGLLMACGAFLPFIKSIGERADANSTFGHDNRYLLFMLAVMIGGTAIARYFFLYEMFIVLAFVLSAIIAYISGRSMLTDIVEYIVVALVTTGTVVVSIATFGILDEFPNDILFAAFTAIFATLYYISKFTKVFEPRVRRLGARRQTAVRYGEGSRPHSRYTHSARDMSAYRAADGYDCYDKTEAYMPGEDMYAEENTIDPGTDNEKEE